MDDGKIIEFASDFVFFDNGHYVIGLPFTSESVAMANYWKPTEQRLNSLCKILKGKVSSITVIIPLKIQLLYQICAKYLHQDDGHVWYLLLHCEFQEIKKTLLAVFDCAKGTNWTY